MSIIVEYDNLKNQAEAKIASCREKIARLKKSSDPKVVEEVLLLEKMLEVEVNNIQIVESLIRR
jgi:hypothetical protein